MSNKMLIDATHPEETRVAVVRGNRIEEYDFESQEKKQLRGNIYLAKVTRVEPSLQAAFIDYGGNRHGFLAFSEIHPDYYQIPVADRQALLEAEAAEARASREAEEAEDSDGDVEAAAEVEAEEAPKKPKRTRRTRKSKKAAEETAEEVETADKEESVEQSEDAELDNKAEEEAEAKEADAGESEKEEVKKPRRRTTRRKPAAKKAKSEETDEPTGDSDDKPESDDGDEPPTIMSAIVEMDEISEPLPGDEASDEEADTETGTDGETEASEAVEAAEEKPKRRRASRPRKRKNAEAEEKKVEAVSEDENSNGAETGDAEETPAAAGEEGGDEEATSEKPKRRSSRRKPSRKKKETQEASENGESADDETSDEDVESVGQEDALEEVPLPRRARKHYKIQEVIKRRQVLLVQVVKEERGTKGAALTTYLSLAGRYSVLMPNTARGGGISRKITNTADRKRLKTIASELEVPEGMGVILRTAGAARTKDEINRDFEYLMRLWEQVRTLTLASTAPCLVYEEGSLIKRSIRDLYDKDTGEILVAGEAGHNEAREFMGMLMPSHERRVKKYKGTQAIFAKHGVESQLDKMVSPQVTLKSGGYLVINQTEALVAVDVNSGRSTREHSVEDTALQTNLEAAEEVARQLRLRDLAGLIVIDFIDMEERRNNRSVEKKLKDCLKNDRARIQVGRISHFGLLEMSRQRMRASVLESTMDVCENCAGTGYVRSESAIALHVFRAIEEHVSRHNKFDCIVKTTPSIAIYILNHKRQSLSELEKKYGLKVLIEGDPDVSGQEFKIEKGEPARGDGGPAPIGFQNEAASEAYDQGQEEEKGEGRRKRSRRRGKKSKEDSESTATTETTGDETPETGASESNDDEAENQNKKKRTRGSRGGRKKREDQESGEVLEASKSGDGDVTSGSGEQAAENTASEATAETSVDTEPVEKPKSRSTVRRKAPIAPKATEEEASASSETTETAPASSPPPRKPRRTTRRAPGKKVGETDNAETETVAVSQESNSTPSISEPAENGEEQEKKKSGWWNRGFFQ